MSASKIYFWISEVTKRIWFRSFLYALLGIATAFVALFVRGLVSEEVSTNIGAPAVGHILTILASSMLAVATFSLAIMVTAFGNVASSATPRATALLTQNQGAQRAVATFIGAFLYSIVSIVALATGAYGSEGRFVLFIVTIVVIVMIVITLIRWVDQLSTLGQVGNTINEVEKATLSAIDSWIALPHLGGNPLTQENQFFDSASIKITSEEVGFLVLIDSESIQKICDDHDIYIKLALHPGSFVYPNRPLAQISATVDQDCLESLADCFVIGPTRKFNQDLRFGFVLLSEIASRALSPAVNDPGTALEVINAVTRLLKKRTDLLHEEKKDSKKNTYNRIFVPELHAEKLIGAAFAPIARDGAGLFEVAVRIQQSLLSLKVYSDEYRSGCDVYASFADEISNLKLKTQFEKNLIAKAVKKATL